MVLGSAHFDRLRLCGAFLLFLRLSGLTDVDAISLSMANLAATSPESSVVAARTIVIAVLSNTLVKTGMAASIGAPALRRTLVPTTGLLLICAVAGAVLATWFAPGV